jgi:hypothetical protein
MALQPDFMNNPLNLGARFTAREGSVAVLDHTCHLDCGICTAADPTYLTVNHFLTDTEVAMLNNILSSESRLEIGMLDFQLDCFNCNCVQMILSRTGQGLC